MIARWRELGLVAGPQWHWALLESRVSITLEEPVAQWVAVEAARRDVTVSRLIGDLLAERIGAGRPCRAVVSA